MNAISESPALKLPPQANPLTGPKLPRTLTPAEWVDLDWQKHTLGDVSDSLDKWCKQTMVTHIWNNKASDVPLDEMVEWTAGLRGLGDNHALANVQLSDLSRIGVEVVRGTESFVLHVFFVRKTPSTRSYRWGGEASMFYSIKCFDDDLVFALARTLTQLLAW